MNTPIMDERQRTAIATAVEAVIRIGVLIAIAAACIMLLRPFLVPVLWGAIIAVAFYPLFLKVQGWLGGRSATAATLISVVLMAALIVPAIVLAEPMLDSARELGELVDSGELRVPPPSEKVAEWPVIGEKVYRAWSQASTNLPSFVEAFRPQLEALGRHFAAMMASGGVAFLFTIIALGIAGAFLANAEVCGKGLTAVARRLGGEQGAAFVADSALVVKSVVTGVIGIALVQALLGGSAMALVGVPLWPLWTLILLVLAVAQIPPLIVMGPVIVYVFATADPLIAVVFAIWGVFVSISDAILKPLFLGRGLEIPTLVILLGAIGGMIVQGVIGLFIGAVVLSIGWQLMVAWVTGEVQEPEPEPAD